MPESDTVAYVDDTIVLVSSIIKHEHEGKVIISTI